MQSCLEYAIFTYDHSNNCQYDRTLCTTTFWRYTQTLQSMTVYILYSSYPRMYLSYPLSILIIYKNTHFFDSNIPCLLHDSRIISSHLHDTTLWLCLWKQLSANLNIKNPGTKRQVFCSLYRHIDMNYQCECVASCKLSKEKLPHNTKFDNVCVRLIITRKGWFDQDLHVVCLEFWFVDINRQWMIAEHSKLSA